MQLLALAGSLFLVFASVAAKSAEHVGPCTKATQDAGQPMPGRFIPQCTDFGFFEATQCHGSTGQCWCVDPETGKAIDGTAKMHEMPDCTMCNIQRAKLLRPTGFVGGFVPVCDEDGLFTSTQHHGSTGHSWCVNKYTGEEIETTRTTPGQQPTDCDAAAHNDALDMHKSLGEKGPCFAKIVEERGSAGTPGFYTPRCTKNGFYRTEQSHGSTGYTWCVNPTTGAEVPGTRRGPGEQKATCGACFKEIEGQITRKPMMGQHLAQCNDENGDYLPVQHYEGSSWCANPKTGEVEGKKHAPGDKTPLPCVNN
jgi:nidogen (entactin)